MPLKVTIDPTQLTEVTEPLLHELIKTIKTYKKTEHVRLNKGQTYSTRSTEVRLTHVLYEREHNEDSAKTCYCFEVMNPDMKHIASGTFASVRHSLGVLSVDDEQISFKAKPEKRILKLERIPAKDATKARFTRIKQEYEFAQLSPQITSNNRQWNSPMTGLCVRILLRKIFFKYDSHGCPTSSTDKPDPASDPALPGWRRALRRRYCSPVSSNQTRDFAAPSPPM